MKKAILYSIFTLLLTSCVEPYDFVVKNKQEGIVIEAEISNVSYNESLNAPSDGRYFQVKIGKLSDVTNVRDEKVSNAQVLLESNQGDKWYYQEDYTNPGTYVLRMSNFKAEFSKEYKLVISLEGGEIFESSWEKMPVEKTSMDNYSITETSKSEYVYKNQDDREIVIREGINVNVSIPKNENKEDIYLKWEFDPTWIFISFDAPYNSPNKKCWVTDKTYMNQFKLHFDKVGDYDKDMFFLQTQGNNKTFHYFSTLISQKSLSKDYFFFWRDYEEQSKSGGLFDQIPFNLSTNYTALNSDLKVNGYFGVVTEHIDRWELDKSELSYAIRDNSEEVCEAINDPTGPQAPNYCDSCLLAPGDSQNSPPAWWERR